MSMSSRSCCYYPETDPAHSVGRRCSTVCWPANGSVVEAHWYRNLMSHLVRTTASHRTGPLRCDSTSGCIPDCPSCSTPPLHGSSPCLAAPYFHMTLHHTHCSYNFAGCFHTPKKPPRLSRKERSRSIGTCSRLAVAGCSRPDRSIGIGRSATWSLQCLFLTRLLLPASSRRNRRDVCASTSAYRKFRRSSGVGWKDYLRIACRMVFQSRVALIPISSSSSEPSACA